MIRNNNRCDISSYGFRYYANETKYAELTRYGTFIFKNGDNIFAVDDDGIGMTFDGDINNLQKVVLKNGLEVLEYEAFSSNYSLKEVNIPTSVTTLRCSAFDDNVRIDGYYIYCTY